MSNPRLKSSPIIGLPSPSFFQTGRLHSSPITAIPVRGNDDGGSESDMDFCSDSDDEVYGGPYSLSMSPQDDKIPIGVATILENSLFMNGFSANGQVHSEVGSTKDTIKPPLFATYTSKDHSSTIQLQPNTSPVVRQVFTGRPLEKKKLANDNVPSAPPFAGFIQEIKQDSEQALNYRASCTPCPSKSSNSATSAEVNKSMPLGSSYLDSTANSNPDSSIRSGAVFSTYLPARLPTFHASGLGPWSAVISYDACVRLCLNYWAKGCNEAPAFLENECALLQTAFGLQRLLLQPEEELLNKRSSELVSEGVALKPKKTCGKFKVQVRRVKMVLDAPTGCCLSSIKPPMVKLKSLRCRLSSIKSTFSSEWEALMKVRATSRILSTRSFSHQTLAYVHAGTHYLKHVSGLLKIGVTSLCSRSSSYEVVQETYPCSLRLKSSYEDDVVRMQPGSSETHVFLPDGLGDDLVVEVFDSKGKYCGHVIAQVADIADNPGDKLRWWPIYHEPEHELVGRIQLLIHYSASTYENSHLKCGFVAETIAYDSVLEAAMKVQNFQQRNLLLHGPWRWLVTEFAIYYGVSDAYTKLRYLSHVMDVATPTADCLNLVHDLLLPVIMTGNTKRTLSCQETRMLAEISDQIEQLIAVVIENYKSLDELSPSGLTNTFRPATGLAAPALEPALKLYTLLHDILSPEAQLKLCKYFQTAVRKRSGRHLAETDDFVSSNIENTLISLSSAYQKMKSLCFHIRNEIFTDIEIRKQHVLPSFVDLPNLSSSIYSSELCNRLRSFLVACPPAGLSPPVADLVIATVDFQRDLSSWNISPVKGGVDAKELFHLYITRWILDKRLELLDSCKLDKVKLLSAGPQHSTTLFVDCMYERLKETLGEYEVIICRWPEYTFILESAIADVERAIVEALDKQYFHVLSSLKENTIPAKAVQYVQRFAKGNSCPYTVPEELGTLFNSMKRMLDVLRPKIESQFKSWGSCIPDGENTVPGEQLGEVTVMLRTKFRNYLQAVVEKLAGNTKLQSATNLKKIIQEANVESDMRSRMQPLKDLLTNTIDCLHSIFETQVFIILCRGFWDRMGQYVLKAFENRKENGSCYKSSRVALSELDDTFASQMQNFLGNALHDNDLEPPRSILEVRSMLCKDNVQHKDNNYYF